MRVLKRNSFASHLPLCAPCNLRGPILVRPVCWPILSSQHYREILPAQPFLIQEAAVSPNPGSIKPRQP